MSRPHLTPSDKKFASVNGEVADKKRHQIDERVVADNFRFPCRCAPRNDDCVCACVCVIARLGTSRGNLSQDELLYDVMLSEVEASPR